MEQGWIERANFQNKKNLRRPKFTWCRPTKALRLLSLSHFECGYSSWYNVETASKKWSPICSSSFTIQKQLHLFRMQFHPVLGFFNQSEIWTRITRKNSRWMVYIATLRIFCAFAIERCIFIEMIQVEEIWNQKNWGRENYWYKIVKLKLNSISLVQKQQDAKS